MDVDSEQERIPLVLASTMCVSTLCRVRRAFASLVSPPSILTNTCRPLRRRSPRQVRLCKTNIVQGLSRRCRRFVLGRIVLVGILSMDGRAVLSRAWLFLAGRRGGMGRRTHTEVMRRRRPTSQTLVRHPGSSVASRRWCRCASLPETCAP